MPRKFKFDGTKHVHDDSEVMTNEKRVSCASDAMFRTEKYRFGTEDEIRDLICDLLHFADCHEFNAMEILRDAKSNWRAER